MTESTFNPYPDGSGVLLRDAFPEVLPEILGQIAEYNDIEGFKDELNSVRIFGQQLAGHPDNFSFMAYAIPRLSYEDFMSQEIRDEKRLDVKYDKGIVTIVINEFGRIDWFYVMNLPEMYEAINKFMPKL